MRGSWYHCNFAVAKLPGVNRALVTISYGIQGINFSKKMWKSLIIVNFSFEAPLTSLRIVQTGQQSSHQMTQETLMIFLPAVAACYHGSSLILLFS